MCIGTLARVVNNIFLMKQGRIWRLCRKIMKMGVISILIGYKIRIMMEVQNDNNNREYFCIDFICFILLYE